MLPVIGGETLPGTSLTLCPHSTYLYEFTKNWAFIAKFLLCLNSFDFEFGF